MRFTHRNTARRQVASSGQACAPCGVSRLSEALNDSANALSALVPTAPIDCAATRMAHDPQLSLTDVQWVLGHAHLTTTQLYVTLTQDEVVQAVQDHHPRRARRRDDPPPPAPGYDPRSLAVLFGRP